MRFFLLIIAVAITIPLPAAAQNAWVRNLYIGAVAGGTEPKGDDGSALSAGGVVGLSWTQNQLYGAVEAEYAEALGHQNDPDIQNVTSASISILAGVRPKEDISIYGRFGFQRAAIELTDSSSDSTLGVRIGVGTNYTISNGFQARAEIGHRFHNGDFDDTLSRTEVQLAIIQQF